MFFPRRFNKLGENEIAGAETINPIIDLICGLRCDSDFLDINANGIGGATFSFNEGVLYNWLASKLNDGVLDFSFLGGINGSKLSVSGGNVYLQHNSIYIQPRSNIQCVAGGTAYVVVDSISSGSIVYGDSSASTLADGIVQPASGGRGNRLVLPILRTVYASGAFRVKYLHFGDFHFVDLPYFWIPSYDKTKDQSLDHAANSDGYVWNTYGECPT